MPFAPSTVQRTNWSGSPGEVRKCGSDARKEEEDQVAPGRGVHSFPREMEAALRQHPAARLARSAMQICEEGMMYFV